MVCKYPSPPPPVAVCVGCANQMWFAKLGFASAQLQIHQCFKGISPLFLVCCFSDISPSSMFVLIKTYLTKYLSLSRNSFFSNYQPPGLGGQNQNSYLYVVAVHVLHTMQFLLLLAI